MISRGDTQFLMTYSNSELKCSLCSYVFVRFEVMMPDFAARSERKGLQEGRGRPAVLFVLETAALTKRQKAEKETKEEIHG